MQSQQEDEPEDEGAFEGHLATVEFAVPWEILFRIRHELALEMPETKRVNRYRMPGSTVAAPLAFFASIAGGIDLTRGA